MLRKLFWMTAGVCDMQKKMKNEKIQGVQAGNMEREQETKEFLKQFYESPEAEEDTIAAKLKRTFVPKGKKTKAIADFAKDLMGEGGAGDVVIDDDMFEADTEGYKQQEKKSLFLLLVAIPLTIAAGFWLTDQSALADWIDRVFGPRKYYLISLVIVLYALLPFFMAFEGRKPEVRELVVLATMIALATAGRAAFFMTPSFKPIIAIVIISAIAFGAEAGFLVGSMTMLVSNFLFGQGPWTPWQMFAMGFIGFLSGILYRLRILPTKRLQLSVYGFLVTFMIYGGIMNPAALFMSVYQFSWSGLLAIYISGVPVDLVHASSTFLFLWIGAKPLLEKLQRIKVKYGLL